MSEVEKKLRSAEEVNQEYAELCKSLGDIHFKELALKGAIGSIELRVRALDSEMQEIIVASKAAAAVPASSPTLAAVPSAETVAS